MNDIHTTLIGGILLTAALLWLTTSSWQRLQPLRRIFLQPLGHSLSLLVVPGVLLFYGLPELAGRYGHSALMGLMAFSIIFMFAPLVLKPMQWIGHQRRFPSLVDFLVFRYRGQTAGQLFAGALALTLIPLGVAQITSFTTALTFLLPPELVAFSHAKLLAPVLFTGLLLGLVWTIDKARFRTLIVLSAVVALLAVNITGLSAITGGFGGHAAMEQWVQQTGQNTHIRRYEFSYGLITTFLCASLVMPQIFHLQAESGFSSRQFSVSSWFFPLLLLVCSYAMFPLLWSGLNLQLDAELQQYLLALPLALNNPWLAALNFSAGTLFALAATALILLSVCGPLASYWRAISPPIFARDNLYEWINRRRRIAASGWLITCLAATLAIRPLSVSDLTLLSLTGLTQLAPALLALFYFPKLTKAGIVAGLLGGLSLWLIGLAIPAFVGEWQWHLPTSGAVIHFGASQWQSWLVEAGVVNIMLCVVVSRLRPASDEEAEAALQCSVDDPPVRQRVTLTQHTLTEMQERLGRTLGPTTAAAEMAQALRVQGFSTDERRPYALRLIRDQLSRQLQQNLGVPTTERLVNQAIPLSDRPATGADDIQLIESHLAQRATQLHGIAAELDRLRLHHRKTLEKLPLGICSLAADGEILLWNSAMAEMTGIPAEESTGSKLEALPHGWGEVLMDAANTTDADRLAREVHIGGRNRWLMFNRTSADTGTIRLVGSQIILMEDVTETAELARTVIHNERLASVGRLAAGVAHEIGNPVTAIDCLAQDLAHEHDPKEILATADAIQKQTHRITRIVRSLMSFSRKEDGEPFNWLPLTTPIEEAIHMLSFQHDAHSVDLINRVDQNFEVLGDVHQLTQVFINLLGNARDASPEHAAVIVNARCEGEMLQVDVDDQGSGIDPEHLGAVFDPFFTTKPAGSGTGLGLALVYTLVKNHGGTIKAASPVPGQHHGTRITVTLPGRGSKRSAGAQQVEKQ